MIQLTENILMIIGFSGRVRTHEAMLLLFNNSHRDRHLITQSVVNKTLEDLINLTEIAPKSGGPKIAINEVVAQDIAIALEEFP